LHFLGRVGCTELSDPTYRASLIEVDVGREPPMDGVSSFNAVAPVADLRNVTTSQ